VKILSIRLSTELWKKLNYLRIEGKIKSIQQAVVDGLYHVADKLDKKSD